MAEEYDLVTLGAGSGGVRASRFAATLYGAKVAVVELPFGWIPSDTVGGAGGTCVIRGCVPKKLLVYSSQFSDEFSDAKGFGWTLGPATHSWQDLINGKAKEIQRLNGLYNNILKSAGVELIEGRGVVIDPNTVEVQMTGGATRRLRARHILVAVGGQVARLDIPGAELAVTSDEALALEDLPQGPIAVLGAGYIACEFANIFRGVGAPVHLLFRGDKVLRGFDEECRAHVTENMERRGITVHSRCQPLGIERGGPDGAALTLRYSDPEGKEQALPCAMVMMATGRKPRTAGLGLEEAGVLLDEHGTVKVDEFSRTAVPSIWAVGDATNRINLTPVALLEGMAFARSALGGELTAPDYEFVPSAVFCQPPLATVGFSEEAAAKELSGEIDVYVSKFKPMKYTMSGKDERTLMKLIVHRESDRVVGCHMVGPDAPEIMQGLAVALKCGATKKQFDSTVGIHPSAAEEFVTMRSKTRTIMGTGASKL